MSLDWNDIPPAFIPAGETIDGYKIYYGGQSGDYAEEIKVSLIEDHSAALPYILDTLQTGGTYYFAISALYVSSAESGLSNEIELAPDDTQSLPAPVMISAVPRDSEIELAWTPVSGAASYRLYYGVVDNAGVPSQDRVYGSSQNIGNDSAIIVSGLINGKTYYFAVTCVDGNKNESQYSNEMSAAPVQ